MEADTRRGGRGRARTDLGRHQCHDELYLVGADGVDGVLRAGSPWGPGSTASLLTYPVDNVFEPEGQQ